jgi:hypothetical protein
MTLGTATAGSPFNSLALNAEVPSGQELSVTNGADVVGVARGQYEYQVMPDAVETP